MTRAWAGGRFFRRCRRRRFGGSPPSTDGIGDGFYNIGTYMCLTYRICILLTKTGRVRGRESWYWLLQGGKDDTTVARGASPSSLRSVDHSRAPPSRFLPSPPERAPARSSSLAMRLLPRSSLLNGHRLLFVVVVSAALLLAPAAASRGDHLPEFKDCLHVASPSSPLTSLNSKYARLHHSLCSHTSLTLPRNVARNTARPRPRPPPFLSTSVFSSGPAPLNATMPANAL